MTIDLQSFLIFSFKLMLLGMLYSIFFLWLFLLHVNNCIQFFTINWSVSEIIRFMRCNRCLDWRRKRWSIGLTFSIGEWYFFDSLKTTSGALRFDAAVKFSFLFIPLEFVFYMTLSFVLKPNQTKIYVCQFIWYSVFVSLQTYTYMFWQVHREEVHLDLAWFFIIFYISLNCCYICIFSVLILVFVYVKYIRSMLFVLL